MSRFDRKKLRFTFLVAVQRLAQCSLSLGTQCSRFFDAQYYSFLALGAPFYSKAQCSVFKYREELPYCFIIR